VTKLVLTDKFLKTVKAKSRQDEYFDEPYPGLSIRVTSAGKKTWSFIFTVPGTDKRARLKKMGAYPAVTLKDAHEIATKAREKVLAGIDPRKVVEDTDMTMEDLVKLRLKKEVNEEVDEETGDVIRVALDSAKEIARRYNKEIIPRVGDVLVKAFCEPREGIKLLNKVLDPIVDRGAKRTAGMVYADMQTLMNFAVRRGEIQYNPLAQVKLIGSVGNTGKRSLDLPEIKTLWHALPLVMPEPSDVPTILKLLLLTAQREGEVCGMDKDEFDLDQKTWLIPGERTKNGFDHLVPLTPPVLTIIRETFKKAPGQKLFPSRKGKKVKPNVAIKGNAVALAVRRALRANLDAPQGKLGMAKWKPHDLRRTVATLMSRELKISHIDKGHVLNHRSTTRKTVTQKNYDVYEFQEEKRAALEKWAKLAMKTVAEKPSKPRVRTPSQQSTLNHRRGNASGSSQPAHAH